MSAQRVLCHDSAAVKLGTTSGLLRGNAILSNRNICLHAGDFQDGSAHEVHNRVILSDVFKVLILKHIVLM